MSKLNVGDTVTVKGVKYEVVLSDQPGPNAKAANPSLVGYLGLRRPAGRKVFGAWQFASGTINIFAAM